MCGGYKRGKAQLRLVTSGRPAGCAGGAARAHPLVTTTTVPASSQGLMGLRGASLTRTPVWPYSIYHHESLPHPRPCGNMGLKDPALAPQCVQHDAFTLPDHNQKPPMLLSLVRPE